MSFRRLNNDSKKNLTGEETKKSVETKVAKGTTSANLPLEYTLATVYILQGISSLKQSQNEVLTSEEIREFLEYSFGWSS